MHAHTLHFPIPDPTPQPQPVPHPTAPTPPELGSRLPLPMVYAPARWHYKHLQRQLADVASFSEEALEKLGDEGWELVGVTGDGTTAHFFFKRLADL
jgi:hypothetical protein